MNKQPEVHYALGYTEDELSRLIRQSALYEEATEALLRNAGISKGMRVLDAGCGPGCVSLLAARLVGPSGAVIGVDKSPEALVVARARADAEHLAHVEFIQGDLDDLERQDTFDALIGRFVLMFLPNPSLTLQKLARNVRKAGIIAFQEMDIIASRTVPEMPIWRKCGEWILETFQQAAVDIQMGSKLHATFQSAGIPPPQLKLEARIGCLPDQPAHEYIASIVASLLPMMERLGVATAAEVEMKTLVERLKDEMIRSNGVIILPSIIDAWSRLPL